MLYYAVNHIFSAKSAKRRNWTSAHNLRSLYHFGLSKFAHGNPLFGTLYRYACPRVIRLTTHTYMVNPMRLLLITAATASLMIASSLATASSGGGFNQSGLSSQRIDQQYEAGKSFYKSPQADGSRLEYCVKSDSGLKKLSRRSVKSFKRGPATAFVDSLYSCADANLKIADAGPDDQGDAILYYLNKRFKLRLTAG